jgi:hypothetical protein
MLLLGLPSLALYAFFLLYYGHVIRIAPGNGFFRNYGMQIGLLQVYAGVILGYTLATAFLKVSVDRTGTITADGEIIEDGGDH